MQLTTFAPQSQLVDTRAAVLDERAFDSIVREHTSHVWRSLRYLGIRHADIDDVFQEVFIVVHSRLSSFEGRSSLRGWISGITVRVAARYRRRAYHKREILGNALPQAISSAHQERELQCQEDWQLVEALLGLLTEEQRQVFMLYEIEELSMTDVAAAIGCPLQTAYSRLHAARKRFLDVSASLRRAERDSRA